MNFFKKWNNFLVSEISMKFMEVGTSPNTSDFKIRA